MKQILLSIEKNLSLMQPEVKDFLSVCRHSPQWIGDETMWHIKSFQIWTKESKDLNGKMQGKAVITALMENEEWKEPNVKALTIGDIYDILKNVDRNKSVNFGCQEGLYGSIANDNQGKNLGNIYGLHPVDDTYFLSNENNNSSYQTTVEDLFSALHLSGFENPDMDSETLDIWRNLTVAWQYNSNKVVGHPVTEVCVDKDKVIVIYNQDIVIE